MAKDSVSALMEEIRKECREAMQECSAKSNAEMRQAVTSFYMGGYPKMYVRTGTLAKTPEIKDENFGGDFMSFIARLRPEGAYFKGKRPSMMQVLRLSNYGDTQGEFRPNVGAGGYWERFADQVPEFCFDIFKKHFS